MYQLTQKAIRIIEDERTNGIVRRLANALVCGDGKINRDIRLNEPNGDLTKIAALEVLREATGLSDKQIIERVAVKEVA